MRSLLTTLTGLLVVAHVVAQQPSAPDPLAARVDPYVDKQRVIVMTDIANEPDDQMSIVHFLVYSNQFDVEGLIATTSTRMKNKVRPDIIQTLIGAYKQVLPRLLQHQPGFPSGASLRGVVVAGHPRTGWPPLVQTNRVKAPISFFALPRRVMRGRSGCGVGGTNTLAQALQQARAAKSPAELDALIARLRVYSISDQDDAGPWIRKEFPSLHYIAMPSTPDGDQYAYATWTGISGDRFYKNAPGADFTTFTDSWVNTNIRSKGPLGKLYPHPCCIHEGDTPTFLGLINNGLASFMSPSYGGWGGRYVWRTFYGESRPFWTQGGDSFPGRDNLKDTVSGVDGKTYTSDQATIWRWRSAFQNDFAARMDWTVKDPGLANHNPDLVVNRQPGRAPVRIDAAVGVPVTLDAAGTRDPDGHTLKYSWFFYPEAGSGIPGQPVFAGGLVPVAAVGHPAKVGFRQRPKAGRVNHPRAS